MLPLRFVAYHRLDGQPHVVVDGSGTAGTRLTLSHWPGSPTPHEVADDLSAQIAFRALDHPDWFDGIDVVSNNHFDQDGLCSAYALVDPAGALTRRERVIDLARAGDFGTWEHRDSARLAMAIASYDDPDRSPLALPAGYEDRCGFLYETLLPMLPDLLDDVATVEPLWAEEDAHLQAGLDAIATGTVTVDEDPELDLAVVTVPDAWADEVATRFTMQRSDPVHPMAINQSTACLRLMVVHGDAIRFEQRYETWVMHPSSPVAPRQDLRDLAALLTAAEPSGATWRGDGPNALTPRLAVADGVSRLSTPAVHAIAAEFFAAAPPAWDPFAPG